MCIRDSTVPDHKRKALVEAFGEPFTKEIETFAETRAKEVALETGYKGELKVTDEQARADIVELKTMVKAQTDSTNELLTALKAAFPPKKEDDAESDEDKKKKADYEAMKKEIVDAAAKSVATV